MKPWDQVPAAQVEQDHAAEAGRPPPCRALARTGLWVGGLVVARRWGRAVLGVVLRRRERTDRHPVYSAAVVRNGDGWRGVECTWTARSGLCPD